MTEEKKNEHPIKFEESRPPIREQFERGSTSHIRESIQSKGPVNPPPPPEQKTGDR